QIPHSAAQQLPRVDTQTVLAEELLELRAAPLNPLLQPRPQLFPTLAEAARRARRPKPVKGEVNWRGTILTH
ncbi:MAG: hypothetical protein QXQ34_02265, partial [Thermofilum sp.]